MKRNCYLDLRLHSSSSHTSMNGKFNIHSIKLAAILHNQRHCIFDTTELQARAIIWLASREMVKTRSLCSEALLVHIPPHLSIKKSLHNFLQRRKKRRSSQRNNDKN
ncbi:protein TIFY 5A-like [Vigna unguiculata]|uniref:protein TIFY 5A-like n=1 Tax=Vigna unguiculata TaxID=3917 RepID=UPI00101649D5|nr:protein TIFY 5A-like [Vigna unguiculata]